jgi:DNA-binding MurR/RpiR family transcriptional regulator
MSYEELIRQARHRMSKSFARLADYLLDSYIQTALMTATELAHEVDVDAATVVRFAQMLGYSGFPELQQEIRQRVKKELLLRPQDAEEPDSIAEFVNLTVKKVSGAVEQTRVLLDVDAIAELVEKIGAARRLIILPESIGLAAAYNLVMLLEQGGFLVSVAQQGATDLARTISTATAKDILLAIDVTGGAPFIARALAEAKLLKIPTAAIVGAASSESAQVADFVLASQSQDDVGLGIIVVDTVVYTLSEAIRWRYNKRFEGKSEAIEALYTRIRVGEGE